MIGYAIMIKKVMIAGFICLVSALNNSLVSGSINNV